MNKIVIMIMLVAAISATALAVNKAPKQLVGTVNINTATAAELMLLPGVGKAKADAVISYRQTSPFKSPQEITKVKGIGDKMFVKIQQNVTVDGPTTAKLVSTTAVNTVSQQVQAPAPQKTGL